MAAARAGRGDAVVGGDFELGCGHPNRVAEAESDAGGILVDCLRETRDTNGCDRIQPLAQGACLTTDLDPEVAPTRRCREGRPVGRR